MTLDQRLDYLLRAALRAEREGEYRIARSLRKMADDMMPIGRQRAHVMDGKRSSS